MSVPAALFPVLPPGHPAPPPMLNRPPVPPEAMALFLDVDGTLLDLAPLPDAVQVPSGLGDGIQAARKALGGALALLSGRALATLDRLFPGPALPAAGLHGLQLRDGRGRLETHAAPGPAMATLRAGLARIVADHPGLLLEDKGGSLALHWRPAPALAQVAQKGARALAQALGEGFVLQHGDHVVEIRPAGPDKGQALRRLMADPVFAGRRPVVFGDDLTDESAFRAAMELGGWGVIVGGRRPTAARHALSGPAAVRDWLAALPQRLHACPHAVSAAPAASGPSRPEDGSARQPRRTPPAAQAGGCRNG